MKVVKAGRPLIVPTERTTCPHCGAELEYEAKDVEVDRIRLRADESPAPAAEVIRCKVRGSPHRIEYVAPGPWPWIQYEVLMPPHRIRCGSCGGRIEVREVPGPPHS